MIIRKDQMEKEVRPNPFGGEGSPVFHHLLDASLLKGEAKMFNIVEFQPGESLGWHGHIDNFEIYYILEGQALVNDNGEEYEVYPGDLVYTADGAHHSIQNNGTGVMKMVATVIFENKAGQ